MSSDKGQAGAGVEQRVFHMSVLGRTLLHLGENNYGRRDVALVELVANAWDAGATNVQLTIPHGSEYDQKRSRITIADNGSGMSPEAIDADYLRVGRNRRTAGGGAAPHGRAVMGRKGIGKLAGFGMAECVDVCTWRDGVCTEFTLDSAALLAEDGTVEKKAIVGRSRPVRPAEGPSGTMVTLRSLKHVGPPDVGKLHEAIARRFSRVSTGQMQITINSEALRVPDIDFMYSSPEGDGYKESEIAPGLCVSYRYGFARKPIRSKELQGFVILARNRAVQAPPFFFDVEARASGQHSTKYVTGEIVADFIDPDGTSDSLDIVSTDRQRIDWEDDRVAGFREWGEKLVREILRECADLRGDAATADLSADPDLCSRINVLDAPSQKQVRSFLKQLGKSEASEERLADLADSLVQAYEFRQFHDFVSCLEEVGEDPDRLVETLARLREWRVLESRAIREVVEGRLALVDKFERMVQALRAETANTRSDGGENLHDLLAEFPWLLNPDWQTLAEERSVTKQLRKWHSDDGIGSAERFDFLALEGESMFVVVEIKRPGKAVSRSEIRQLEDYCERLSRSKRDIRMALVYSGALNVPEHEKRKYEDPSYMTLLTWQGLIARARRHYGHYRAVLERSIGDRDFDKHARELARARAVLKHGASRAAGDRRGEIGEQYVDYEHSDESDDAPVAGDQCPTT